MLNNAKAVSTARSCMWHLWLNCTTHYMVSQCIERKASYMIFTQFSLIVQKAYSMIFAQPIANSRRSSAWHRKARRTHAATSAGRSLRVWRCHTEVFLRLSRSAFQMVSMWQAVGLFTELMEQLAVVLMSRKEWGGKVDGEPRSTHGHADGRHVHPQKPLRGWLTHAKGDTQHDAQTWTRTCIQIPAAENKQNDGITHSLQVIRRDLKTWTCGSIANMLDGVRKIQAWHLNMNAPIHCNLRFDLSSSTWTRDAQMSPTCRQKRYTP